jgi:hypothetical protein
MQTDSKAGAVNIKTQLNTAALYFSMTDDYFLSWVIPPPSPVATRPKALHSGSFLVLFCIYSIFQVLQNRLSGFPVGCLCEINKIMKVHRLSMGVDLNL